MTRKINNSYEMSMFDVLLMAALTYLATLFAANVSAKFILMAALIIMTNYQLIRFWGSDIVGKTGNAYLAVILIPFGLWVELKSMLITITIAFLLYKFPKISKTINWISQLLWEYFWWTLEWLSKIALVTAVFAALTLFSWRWFLWLKPLAPSTIQAIDVVVFIFWCILFLIAQKKKPS